MVIMEAPARGGKDLEVTQGRIVVTIEVQVPFIQGRIPWMDPMDLAGEGKM